MQTKDFQHLCSKTVKDIDKKHQIARDPYLTMAQLMEEMGELTRCINSPKLRKNELDMKNLEEELADVLMQLCILAELYGVDLEKAVKDKIAVLGKRHGIKIKNS